MQNLVGKPELRVFKDGSSELLHFFFGLSTKLCLIISFRILTKFSSINEENVVISEAEEFLKEVNDDLSGCLPCRVSLVDGEYQLLLSNDVVLPFENEFLSLYRRNKLKLCV